MKYVNAFFIAILAIQGFIQKLEIKIEKYKKYNRWVFLGSIFVAFLSLMGKNIIFGGFVFTSAIILLALERIVGWKESVEKWLKVCVVYNLYFSVILTSIIQGYIKDNISIELFIALYSFIWLFLSLISNSEVSLLVNEIISGLAATVFTIGTYLTSMKLGTLSPISDYESYFPNPEALENALINENLLAWEYIKVELLNFLQTLFMTLLPIIGISALCIIFVKVKKYWLKKNGKKEPEGKASVLVNNNIA